MINITQIYNPSYKTKEIEFNTKISIHELNTVPNGSLESVYCDILDTIDISKRISVQNEIMKKVMIGGSVHIKILNILLLSKAILKGDILLEDINSVIQYTLSVVDERHLNTWISQYTNYTVEKIDIDRLYTDIVMKRTQ